MDRLLCSVFFIACSVIVASGAEQTPTTLYVQLVRATDAEKPKNADWKPIGPKLSKRISPVFRWKNYWEVNRHTVAVEEGTMPRLHLTPERGLEITARPGGDLEIRLYRDGKLARKSWHKTNQKMTIMGGKEANGDGWFVVVRRDKPGESMR